MADGTACDLRPEAPLPTDLQAKSTERTGADVVTLDAGHMAMVIIPDQVAGILNKLAR